MTENYSVIRCDCDSNLIILAEVKVVFFLTLQSWSTGREKHTTLADNCNLCFYNQDCNQHTHIIFMSPRDLWRNLFQLLSNCCKMWTAALSVSHLTPSELSVSWHNKHHFIHKRKRLHYCDFNAFFARTEIRVCFHLAIQNLRQQLILH